uniref:Taste receptor type 2 n=1 Tax=Sciurus vulgaris TaxID=55149 RepID=A0A8D2CR53_SCIVU
MGNIVRRILETILSVEFIMGVLGNGFITVVNCMDWVKRRKISSADQILTALAISRSGQLWSLLINALICVLYPGVFMSRKMIRIMTATWTVTNHFSIWLAASLSIFYFLKIANFSNSLFLYLKWRVKKVVSVILLVSLVLLFLNIVSVNTQIEVWIGGYKGTLSNSSSLNNTAQFSRPLSFINIMFTFIPFTVSLMTFLLLIFSLRMQHKARGPRDASTTAHVKALQTVTAFLLLHTTFLFSRVIQISNSELISNKLVLCIGLVIGAAFPSGHSFVLILRTHKLKQASRSVLWWLRSRSQDFWGHV